MPTISVIVPVYNAELYLHQCLDSILGQTYQDFELILVDDGSPDGCPVICDAYAQKDSRVRALHQVNQGQAAARNHGVSAARGEWVCFVDSDDLIHPQMLEYLHRATVEQGAHISMCGAVEAGKLPEQFSQPQTYTSISRTMDEAGLESLYHEGEHRYWVVWGKLIRKEIVEKLPLTTGRIYEDNAMVFRWLHAAQTVADIPNRFYFYQVNPAGTTKKGFSEKQLDFLWALQEQISFYAAIGYKRMTREAVAYYLKAGSWYLPRVRDELHNRKIAAVLRRKMRKLMREFSLDELPLTDCEWQHICNVTPSLAQRIVRKIKRLHKAGRKPDK